MTECRICKKHNPGMYHFICCPDCYFNHMMIWRGTHRNNNRSHSHITSGFVDDAPFIEPKSWIEGFLNQGEAIK